jgi:hypothetical protein
MRPEHAHEEVSGDLVVLRVGRGRLDRDLAAAQLIDERLMPRLLVLDRAALLAQAQRANRANPGAEQGLRHQAAIDERLREPRQTADQPTWKRKPETTIQMPTPIASRPRLP